MTIDAHCHLSQTDYDQPIDQIINDAKDIGVDHILAVACDPNDWPEEMKLLKTYDNLYGAIGIHPEYADHNQDLALSKIPQLFSQQKRLVAVGEIGLDYHESGATPDEQKRLFQQQILLAHQIQSPIMIHTRDAQDDTISILSQAYKNHLLSNGGVIHCFTGTQELADFAISIGFYISISGVITFKSAQNLREVVKALPLDRLLVETDAPWLAPVPFRGQKNQPAYVQKTLETLAQIRSISIKEMEQITSNNFYQLFHKDITNAG